METITIEISKNESDRVDDLIIYKNHYALIKKIQKILDHNKSFVCRRCLNSYTNHNALTNHKEKCGDDNICTSRTSNKSHLHWKKHFQKNRYILGLLLISKLIRRLMVLV